MEAELEEGGQALTAEEILTFGPCVEAQVWHPVWLMQERAPIAVAAGRPKFGPVFNDDGIGKAVVIRPCISRGKRIRGLPPIYTPGMLEANAGVFTGWPMFMDHVPPQLAEALAKKGRSVKELGGQVIKPWWQQDFMHEDDAQYGYEKGGTLAEIWATKFIREMVGENANLLHTSINAWPTAGKPGKHRGVRGMLIEGIRRQPQGSLDYVVRGGAGGRLLPIKEGEENVEGEWPQIAEADAWPEEARSFVVSLAESYYSAPAVDPNDLKNLSPDQLRQLVQEHAPHLLPALSESQANGGTAPVQPDAQRPSLTEEDVRRIFEEATAKQPKPEELREQLREEAEQLVEEREGQRTLSAEAHRLIESAEGIPAAWKADLKARYSMLPSGPATALLVEEEQDDDGKTLTEMEVLTRNVKADLDHARDLIAEATGKPRVKGEGGRKPEADNDSTPKAQESEKPYWRERFSEMGIVESEDKALAIHGVEKVEG